MAWRGAGCHAAHGRPVQSPCGRQRSRRHARQGGSMRTSLVLALGVALAPWAVWAQTDGYTLDDFQLRTSGDLLDICALDESHVSYWEARGFCLGFVAGGIHFHDAIAASDDFPRIACPVEGVTRSDVVEAFVA